MVCGMSNFEIIIDVIVVVKYGVFFFQYVDFVIMCGDVLDGFFGVVGVGEKMVVILLQVYVDFLGICVVVEVGEGMSVGVWVKIFVVFVYFDVVLIVVVVVIVLLIIVFDVLFCVFDFVEVDVVMVFVEKWNFGGLMMCVLVVVLKVVSFVG